MTQTLMVTAVDADAGKSTISLGLLEQFSAAGARTRFFKPVSFAPPGEVDQDVSFVLTGIGRSDTALSRSAMAAMTADEVMHAIEEDGYDELLDQMIERFSAFAEGQDIIICEGVDSMKAFPALESDINLDIAKNVGATMLLVANGKDVTVDEIISNLLIFQNQVVERGAEVLGAIVNRVQAEKQSDIADVLRRELKIHGIRLFGVVPELDILSKPRLADILAALDADLLSSHDCKRKNSQCTQPIGEVIVTAMGLENTLHRYTERCLLITPGDREELLLAAAAAHATNLLPKPSAVILTGGFEPRRKVLQLVKALSGGNLPILRVETDTYQTTLAVHSTPVHLSAHQEDKAIAIRRAMEDYVDIPRLMKMKFTPNHEIMTPRRFLRKIRNIARRQLRTIVLPEGNVDRILHATHILRAENLVKIILLGEPNEIRNRAKILNVELDDGVTIICPQRDPRVEDYTNTLVELRKHKNLHPEAARDRMFDRTWFGTMMVYKGHADGMVSGSTTTTAATLRPALQFIRTRPGFKSVSSVFFMLLPEKVLVYGDCAIIPNPTDEQLAEIAISSARTAAAFDVDPKVAMLSYSTGSSGSGADVKRVAAATKIVRERQPDLLVEGPIQYDAAVEPSVAKTKLPNSVVAGKATVLIFPDLNTGNNTYKAVQRSAGAIAIGPVLQGLNKPVNDLSRGATVTDIVNTVLVTAIQSQTEDKPKE